MRMIGRATSNEVPVIVIVSLALMGVPLAGCIGSNPLSDAEPTAGNETEGGDGSDGNVTNGSYTVETVDWSGSTGPNACVGPATGSSAFCFGVHSWAGHGVDLGPAPEDAKVSLSGTVNLTWQADAPVNDELRIRLAACQEECEPSDEFLTEATGSSPLHLEIVDAETPTDRRVHLIVDVPDSGPGPTEARMSTDQSFTAEGRIVVAAAP